MLGIDWKAKSQANLHSSFLVSIIDQLLTYQLICFVTLYSTMAHLVEQGGLDALKDDPFTDFEVRCKGKVWRVHKTHLCGNSKALMKHCTEMRVSRSIKSAYSSELI